MKRGWSLGCAGLLPLVLTVAWFQGMPMEKRTSGRLIHSEALIQTPARLPLKALSAPRLTVDMGNVGAIAPAGEHSSEVDIQGAIKDVIATTDPVQQSDAAEALVASIPSADLANWVTALADSSLSGSVSEMRERFIRRWAGEKPSVAAAWAAQQPAPALRQEALNQVALAWAERDVAQALEWAAQLPADEAQAAILNSLGYEVARTEPVSALALAVTLPPESGRDDLMVHAVSQWASTDALAATEWACAIPEIALRERVLAAIATAAADQSPEAAVVLTTQTLWPGKYQNQAVIAIVQRWSQQDPQGASLWVQQFPAGEVQNTAVELIEQLIL